MPVICISSLLVLKQPLFVISPDDRNAIEGRGQMMNHHRFGLIVQLPRFQNTLVHEDVQRHEDHDDQGQGQSEPGVDEADQKDLGQTEQDRLGDEFAEVGDDYVHFVKEENFYSLRGLFEL